MPQQAGESPAEESPEPDFYYEGDLLVFTAAYHRRRGYCCGSGCRHCPWRESSAAAVSSVE